MVAATAVAVSMVSAGGADAAPVACTIKSYKPSKFIVAGAETTKFFDVVTSTGCVADSWEINFGGGLVLKAATNLTGLTIDPTQLTNADAGGMKVAVSAKSKTAGAARGKKTFNFYLQRRTTFGTTLNVAEPGTVNQNLKVVGTLKRINWGTTPKFAPFAKVKVQVQFKAKGTTTYKNIKTVTTDTSGKIATTVVAKKSGSWRLHYAGNSIAGLADSNVDAVTVTS